MIHDGYGQTESIILAANLPALPIRPGSMGKPFPGHDLRVIGEDGGGAAGRARSATSRCAGTRRRSSASTGRARRRPPPAGAASGT